MIDIKRAIPQTTASDQTVTQAEKKLADAAKMYEKQFLREMMKAMRSTVPGDGLVEKGQAEKIFQEQLDQEYVEAWGDKGGLGLHQIIYDQLMERYGTQLGVRPQIHPPKGPIPLEGKTKFSIEPQPSASGESTYKINKVEGGPPGGDDSVKLVSPWKSELLGRYPISETQQAIELGHSNGLRSRFLVDSSFRMDSEKNGWEAGESIGDLGANLKSYYWSVDEFSAASGPDNGRG